jgi:redox-regulated HSP33 family molecular chaperone
MLDRELLETTSLKEICACRYYDLADYMDITTDQELQDIVNHKILCEMCGE